MPAEEQLVDSMIDEEIKKPMTSITGVHRPRYGSPDWEPYVLSLLKDDESDEKGFPKTAGLRRVFNLLFDCVETGPATYSLENGQALVSHRLRFRRDESEMEVADVGESNSENTDHPYNLFSMSVAATRAEGRALRKALLISKLVAEELSKSAAAAPPVDADGPITSTQINAVNIQCQKLDINVLKFIGRGGFKTIETAHRKDGTNMLTALSKYQSGEKKIANELKGYDPNWRKSQ